MKVDTFFKRQKKYKPNFHYLHYFINEFWFIPSDILQRGMEINIWSRCIFNAPILEIGIGDGKISHVILKNHDQIDVGIDIEESGLETARAIEISKGKKRYKKVLMADAEKMLFKDATFRTVISNSTFEHINKDTKAVAEVSRILKKGGLFFLTVPSKNLEKWILEYEAQRDSSQAKENIEKFNSRTQHHHYRTLAEWKRILDKNDLELVFYNYYFPKKVALYWYKIFKFFTSRIGKREVWSLIGDSRLTPLLPRSLIKKILELRVLSDAYSSGFFVSSGEGAQLFMVAKKI